MEGTVQAIGLTTEMRDPYTSGHQQRAAKLASAIASEMGLSQDQIDGIRVAGTLHDIGKIAVPSEIMSTIEFPWPVAQMMLQHHERIDGSGYPLGLKGDNIMIEAAIMAVADVVESMASHRPYRPAFSVEKALLEIIQKRGVLYNPQVVDACTRLFSEKGFTL
jgi:HD-GYP domain-containing protein (c-di-GMP phosphodiesterase class II)